MSSERTKRPRRPLKVVLRQIPIPWWAPRKVADTKQAKRLASLQIVLFSGLSFLFIVYALFNFWYLMAEFPLLLSDDADMAGQLVTMYAGLFIFGAFLASLFAWMASQRRYIVSALLKRSGIMNEHVICEGCGYSRLGAVTERCPECGLPWDPIEPPA